MSGIMGGGGGGGDLPKPVTANPSRMAEKILAVAGPGVEKNKKFAASMMTAGWNDPKLAKPGLLGL